VDEELRDQVKRLTDRAEIYDCIQRYARGIDRQDRALLRSAYHLTISGGRFVDRLERRDGRWAIVDRVCLVEFMEESQSLLTDEAIAMVPGARTPSHDTTDPSYARPLAASRIVTTVIDQLSAQP
jgi:hypothetical protein